MLDQAYTGQRTGGVTMRLQHSRTRLHAASIMCRQRWCARPATCCDISCYMQRDWKRQRIGSHLSSTANMSAGNNFAAASHCTQGVHPPPLLLLRVCCVWRSSYAEGQTSHELECHPQATSPVTTLYTLYIVCIDIGNIYPVTWCSGRKRTAAGAVMASFSEVSRDTQCGERELPTTPSSVENKSIMMQPTRPNLGSTWC